MSIHQPGRSMHTPGRTPCIKESELLEPLRSQCNQILIILKQSSFTIPEFNPQITLDDLEHRFEILIESTKQCESFDQCCRETLSEAEEYLTQISLIKFDNRILGTKRTEIQNELQSLTEKRQNIDFQWNLMIERHCDRQTRLKGPEVENDLDNVIGKREEIWRIFEQKSTELNHLLGVYRETARKITSRIQIGFQCLEESQNSSFILIQRLGKVQAGKSAIKPEAINPIIEAERLWNDILLK
jgi:hypothetical protein